MTNLEQAPDDEWSHFIKNNFIMMRGKRYDEAVKAAEEFIAKYPGFRVGYGVKANIISRFKRYDEAASLFKKAIELSPIGTYAYYSYHVDLGYTYLISGLFEDAIKPLEIASDPDCGCQVEANWYLCEVYIRIGDKTNAEKHLNYLPQDFQRPYSLGRKVTTRACLEKQVAAIAKVTK